MSFKSEQYIQTKTSHLVCIHKRRKNNGTYGILFYKVKIMKTSDLKKNNIKKSPKTPKTKNITKQNKTCTCTRSFSIESFYPEFSRSEFESL